MANELSVAQERDRRALSISVASGFSYAVPFSSVRRIPAPLASWTQSRRPTGRSVAATGTAEEVLPDQPADRRQQQPGAEQGADHQADHCAERLALLVRPAPPAPDPPAP